MRFSLDISKLLPTEAFKNAFIYDDYQNLTSPISQSFADTMQ